MEAVERHVADTETEAQLKRLKEITRTAGANGITRSEVTRASQWLKSRDRDEILLALIETGDSPWRDLPPEFGKWNTVSKRFHDWVKGDVFKGIFNAVSDDPTWNM